MKEYIKYSGELKNIELSNYAALMRYARKIIKLSEKIFLEKNITRIAVLSYGSCQYFVQMLYVLFCKYKHPVTIYEGQFNGIKMDALDMESDFYKFKPNVVIILSDYREYNILPNYLDDQDTVNQKIEIAYKDIENIWNNIHKYLPQALILQSNIVLPLENLLGNLSLNCTYSEEYYFKKVNILLTEKHPKYVTIVGMDELSARIGKNNWFDESAYALNKTTFSLKYLGIAADCFVRLVSIIKGDVRKCLVLDLDNTIWGGVVSEEGCLGIKIDNNDAVGETFYNFQKYVKKLRKRGIALAVCSKNDEHIAKQPFIENNKMVLKLDDFSVFIANWNNKADNIRIIAEKLNIGINSMVFFDDNPAERELVKQLVPEILVVDVPEDSAKYIRALDQSNAFECMQLTKEDLDRADTYTANNKRENLLSTAGSYQQYLQSLEMSAIISPVKENSFERFVQLINKTNQFNLRTQRYSEAEINALKNDDSIRMFTVQLKDIFSDYGIIGCVILRKDGMNCEIDTFVMSCRVLKRGIEYIVMQYIYNLAKNWGCSTITGEYIPTLKNGMVKELYSELGFSLYDHNESVSKYAFSLNNELPDYSISMEVKYDD